MTARQLSALASIGWLIHGCGADTGFLEGTPADLPLSGAAESPLHSGPDARPKIRWWWTCGDISRHDIAAELAQMAEAGFGAAEVLCILSADPAHNGWGSPGMTDRMQAALAHGSQLGIQIDFTLGPAWPLVVPGLAPDSPGMQEELVYGSTVVAGGTTFSGRLPTPPPAAPGVTQRSIVAVQAVRCAARCTEVKPVQLRASSSIDLTGSVRNESLTWTAPSGGPWLLFAFWRRGSGQTSVVGAQVASVSPAYVVDHFSAAGARLVTRFWDTTVLTPAMRGLLATTDSDFFVDSLELVANLLWTPDLPGEFARRRGYTLTPYLPALFIAGIHTFGSAATPDSIPDYEFVDGIGTRVRIDYAQTLTELYQQQHLAALRGWARSLGLSLRVQSYGTTIDASQAAMAVDVPEVEPLGRFGQIDQYRAMASATHVGGKPVLSFECCAEFDAAYAQTWQAMLQHIQEGFAGGVNQVVVHGFPTEHGLGLPWPGFSPFTLLGGNGFSEAWGPRQPIWQDMPKLTGWLTRMQGALRQGRAVVDVAIYHQRYWQDGIIYPDPALGERGYSYDFIDAFQLERPASRVQRGRLLPDGPAYRALILDNETALPVSTALRLLEHAHAGLPVVVVGAVPSHTPGAPRSPREDQTLREVVVRLLALPTVARVPAREVVPAALAELGVRPAAELSPGTEIRVVHRAGRTGDLYYLYNHGTTAATTRVVMEGVGPPVQIDPWTGATPAIALYRTVERDRIAVPITLGAGDAMLVMRTPAATRLHAVDTTGGEILDTGEALILRATRPGRQRVVLSDGRVLERMIDRLPPGHTLADWHLTVSDWRQGTDGQVVQIPHDLDLQGLAAWSELPELEDVSGIGSYRASFDLPDGLPDGSLGAYLELGTVTGTFDVAVNGRALPPVNQTTARVDIGPYLVPGRNTVAVEVATTLRNRLRVTPGFPGQAVVPRQPVGLIGPVQVIPYRQIVLHGGDFP